MPSRPYPKRKTGNRSRATRKPRTEHCHLCGERKYVDIHEKDMRFVEPAGPAPPFEPPRPAFRKRAHLLPMPVASKGVSRGQLTVSSVPSPIEAEASMYHRTMRRSIGPVSRKPETVNRELKTGNRKPKTGNRKPATANRSPGTGNRPPNTGMTREEFLRTGSGLGGAFFAAALGLGKRKKKK